MTHYRGKEVIMKKLVFILPAVFLLLVTSCSQSAVTDEMLGNQAYSSSGAAPPTTVVPRLTVPAPTTIQPAPDYNGPVISVPWRMIVRTGQMSIVVEDVTVAIERITELAQSTQGYVVSSNSWRDGERLRGIITIRVPTAEFTNILTKISSIAVEVSSQTTSSQDVTEEFVDLTAKLKNLEATEQQLLKIMEKAEKVEDILAIQRELTNTRQQIEQIKGRMQYLEQTSATYLIEVSLEQSKLDAKFTVNRRFIKSGEVVQFSSQVGGGFPPYSYSWDFGDGKTSNDASPLHKYRGSGDYTITLTITDDRGNSDTVTLSDYITVQPGWSAGNIAGNAWNGLASFGRVLLNIVIWLGIFSPVWIIGGGIVYWLVRRRRKKA